MIDSILHHQGYTHITNSTALEGVQKGHMGLGSGLNLACNITIIAHMLRVDPSAFVAEEEDTQGALRYLASDIHADILTWPGLQQRS